MSDTKTTPRPGTVVRYQSERADRWCREGMAIADDRGVLRDTYWDSGNNHVLTDSEAATAEILFVLAEYRELPQAERLSWDDYHSDDRRWITSQHGLVVRLFVRIGAEPDLGTRIENARGAVREAEKGVDSAKRTLEWRRQELAKLEAIAAERATTP